MMSAQPLLPRKEGKHSRGDDYTRVREQPKCQSLCSLLTEIDATAVAVV